MRYTRKEPIDMEVLLISALFVALPVLSIRYGHDSRDGVSSKERELASYGVTWSELAGQQELAAESDAAWRERRAYSPAEAARA